MARVPNAHPGKSNLKSQCRVLIYYASTIGGIFSTRHYAWVMLVAFVLVIPASCGDGKTPTSATVAQSSDSAVGKAELHSTSAPTSPWPASGASCKGILVRNVEELQMATEASKAGDIIALSEGVFELPLSLSPQVGTTLCGQGAGKTIVRGASVWKPSTDNIPKTEDPNAYLFIVDKRNDVTIRDMSLQGPHLHGAVYGHRAERLTLAGLEVRDFLWSSVRTIGMIQMRVYGNAFIDAGGRYKNTTGGALYNHYAKECEVWNNRVHSSQSNKRPFYGFKGRGGRDCRFHHNDIRQNFAIEYPFDNNIGFEIDHNYIEGTISIPKHGGGSVLEDDTLSFHIHHNVIRRSYAIEFARNNVRIDHNLFDLDPNKDGGNLITNHGSASSPGPVWIHDNLIRNVGRGVFWSRGIYNRIDFMNNHVRALTSPRTTAFFQFNGGTDFQTVRIESNVFESKPDNPRPLLRNGRGSSATIQNNTLTNILDTGSYANPGTGDPVGPTQPLQFTVGVHNEIQVDQWSTTGVNR